MVSKPKRQLMIEALKERKDVRAFVDAGGIDRKGVTSEVQPKKRRKAFERRIAVTVRLPEKIAHALIDASAERRKNREKAWSQQDIVSEALRALLQD